MLAQYRKTSNDDNELVDVPIGSLARIPPYWPRKWPPTAADVMSQWHHVCTANNCLPFGNPRGSPACAIQILALRGLMIRTSDNDIYSDSCNLQFYALLIVLRSSSLRLSVPTATSSPGRQYRTACLLR
jgi:hypothetical protein